MTKRVGLSPKSLQNAAGESLMMVSARLMKLRHERQLVERAIIALKEVSRTRQSRSRRAGRS